jgi:hypothetical protein
MVTTNDLSFRPNRYLGIMSSVVTWQVVKCVERAGAGKYTAFGGRWAERSSVKEVYFFSHHVVVQQFAMFSGAGT